MVKVNKSKIISFSLAQVDLIKHNQPGLYFLFNENLELIYIGESKYPLIRIQDHFFKHYTKAKKTKRKKGIGPIFKYFRIIQVKNRDTRIRQHYEKRWLRRFRPLVNETNSDMPYTIQYKQLINHMLIFDDFFASQMSWYRYINDEVIRREKSVMENRNKRRREQTKKRKENVRFT
jgi:hypothetical protein